MKKNKKNSKKIASKKIKPELKLECPKCGAKPGFRCRNTKTGAVKSHVHDVRLSEVNAKPKQLPMTDEQKEIGARIADAVNDILGGVHGVELLPYVTKGAVVTTYRLKPNKHTRVSQIESLAKDFAVILGAEAIQVKRMPGETAVGVYVPNKDRKIISWRDTIKFVQEFAALPTDDGHQSIPIMLGQDADGAPVVDDLVMQPHLLVAGTTGGGKSTLLHGMTASMAYVMPVTKLKLIISDTKGVEFTHFTSLPHLQFPIATSVFETMQQLNWAKEETQRRFGMIAGTGMRNIHEYNRVSSNQLPFVVIVIDELADLMGAAVDKDIAKACSAMLQAIVQRSRTSGIYVIAGTQRPDVKTVAGAIKANFPSRLTFRLPSTQDSRTVINAKGAEQLMSRGDMLYSSSMRPELRRMHAPYTSIDDVKAAVQYVIHRETGKYPQTSSGFGVSSSIQ